MFVSNIIAGSALVIVFLRLGTLKLLAACSLLFYLQLILLQFSLIKQLYKLLLVYCL